MDVECARDHKKAAHAASCSSFKFKVICQGGGGRWVKSTKSSMLELGPQYSITDVSRVKLQVCFYVFFSVQRLFQAFIIPVSSSLYRPTRGGVP